MTRYKVLLDIFSLWWMLALVKKIVCLAPHQKPGLCFCKLVKFIKEEEKPRKNVSIFFFFCLPVFPPSSFPSIMVLQCTRTVQPQIKFLNPSKWKFYQSCPAVAFSLFSSYFSSTRRRFLRVNWCYCHMVSWMPGRAVQVRLMFVLAFGIVKEEFNGAMLIYICEV